MYFYLTWKFSSGILMTWSWKMQSTLPFWLWKRGKFIQVFRYLENWKLIFFMKHWPVMSFEYIEPHNYKLCFNLVCRFEGQISGKNIEIGIIDEKRVFKYAPSPLYLWVQCRCKCTRSWFLQGGWHDFWQCDYCWICSWKLFPSSSSCLVTFIQKYLLLPTLRMMFTFIIVNHNFFAMRK